MRKNGVFKVVWLLVSTSVFLLVSKPPARAGQSFQMYLENDSRLLKPNHNTDRHYTNGLKFVYMTDQWQADWFRDLEQLLWADSDGQDIRWGTFLGQNIYTPDHVSRPDKRNPHDRVFAGWLYTGLFTQRISDHTLDHVELNLGVIGPSSKAEQSQDCIHEFFNSNKARGWESQLGDEMAADVTWMRRQRVDNAWFRPSSRMDLFTEIGFTAGSVHRHAEIGLIGRYGWNLPGDFGPGRLNFPVGTLEKTHFDEKVYLFTRITGRVVEHNRFLSGLTHQPFTGEIQVGAVYQKGRFECGYSQTFMTQEYEGQSGVDSFGALTLSWRY